MESKTTSSLALLDEIKVLAKASEDIKPIVKTNQTIATGEKKKVTLELSFALDEIKNSISQAAFSEASELQNNKKKEEAQRELEKKQAESSEAIRIANEIAIAEANQKSLDRERHIEQLRIQYQAACAIDPNTPKPQELQEIDDTIAAQKLAEAKVKQAEEEKIRLALQNQKNLADTKRKKEQAEKRKLILSVSGALVTVAAGFAFFVMSTPEEPKVQPSLAPVVTEFKQSEAELARIKKMQEDAALRKKIEEDARRSAEIAAAEKQKEEEEKRKPTRKPVTGGDKGNDANKGKKGKGFSIGLDGF